MITKYHSGDVVIMELPFTAGTGSKRRPTLVLIDTGDADMIVAPITSRASQGAFDVPLIDWQQDGLALPSVVRVHKPVTTEKSRVERRLGVLTSDDWARVRAKVQELWAAI